MRKSCQAMSIVYRTFIILIVLVSGCTREKEQPRTGGQLPAAEVVGTPTLLATIADDELPHAANTDPRHKNTPAAQAQTAFFHVEMNAYGRGVAYIAKVGDQIRVIHNGKPGKLYKDVDSYTLALSPDGQRVSYAAEIAGKWVMVHDGREEGPFDSLGPAVFSPDSRHLAFECKTGEQWRMFLDGRMSGATFSYIDKPEFSGDSQHLFYGESADSKGNQRTIVSDLDFKNLRIRENSGGPFTVNSSRTRIAVMNEHKNKKRILEFSFKDPGAVTAGALYDEVHNLSYSSDVTMLSYIAKKGNISYLVFNGKEERLPEGEYPWPPVIRPDNRGVGIAVAGKDGAYLHQAFYNDGIKSKRYKEIADIVYSSDGSLHAYVAIKNERFLIVANGKEGPMFDRVISPQFSPDGKYLVYRARQDGKRFVVVADADGKIRSRHPDYEQLFPVVFTADGRSVAYGVKDGEELWWKVEKLD